MPMREATDPRRAVNVGVGAASPLWPVFVALAGAGVAYWWWSQWARGGATAGVISSLPAPLASVRPTPPASLSANAPAAQPTPVETAPPELVMAHVPPPPEAPDAVSHPTDQGLERPAPEIMAHSPPETVGVSFKDRSGFEHRAEETPVSFPDTGGAAQAGAGEASKVEAEALATGTSAAALTDGEVVDEVVSPTAASEITGSLGVLGAAASDAPPKAPRKRKPPAAKAPDAG